MLTNCIINLITKTLNLCLINKYACLKTHTHTYITIHKKIKKILTNTRSGLNLSLRCV